MISETNPHRVNYNGCEFVYWKGNTACGRDDADRVEITIQGRYGPCLKFVLPREVQRLDGLRLLLDYVFTQGRRHQARAIQALIGDIK